ncbi:ribonuclease P/MRP protein subunit POP5 [Panulirus ornatus]|uniref:ribonuclease P/MRP protein subunit POP5 n=1 Tax=Panulirus ornatus TaxID=150431 RepID=UPI003A8C30AF
MLAAVTIRSKCLCPRQLCCYGWLTEGPRCFVYSVQEDMVRFKKRYFVVEVVPENHSYFRWNALYKAVVESVKRLHGDFGLAATAPGFHVKYCNVETRIAFVSVGRGPHLLVASALPLITEIGGQAASVRTIHVAASMKQGFLFVKKYHEKKLKELEASLNPVEKQRWRREKAQAMRYR